MHKVDCLISIYIHYTYINTCIIYVYIYIYVINLHDYFTFFFIFYNHPIAMSDSHVGEGRFLSQQVLCQPSGCTWWYPSWGPGWNGSNGQVVNQPLKSQARNWWSCVWGQMLILELLLIIPWGVDEKLSFELKEITYMSTYIQSQQMVQNHPECGKLILFVANCSWMA